MVGRRGPGGGAVSDAAEIAAAGAAPRFLRLDRVDWLLVAALVLLAAAIRFWQLGSESLWLDEATTYWRSGSPIADLVASSIKAGHTPTYFLLMHAWLKLGGSEFMLRAPSAVFGALTVPLCYALGGLVGGRRVALVAALLVTLSTFHLYYAQEARSYALLTLCVAVAMLGLVWLAQHPARALLSPRDWRRDGTAGLAWAAYVLGSLGALAVHNMAVFFLLAASLVFALLALRLRGQGLLLSRNWLLAHAVIIAVWVWWWPVLLRQGAQVIGSFWIPEPSLDLVLGTLSEAYLDGGHGVLSVALAPCALLGAWILRRQPWLLATLVALAAAAPLALLALSPVRPLFYARQLVWTTMPFYLLAACGIAAIRPKPLYAAALAILLVEGALKLDRYYRADTKVDWRGLVTLLAREVEPDGRVAVAPGALMRLIDYYLPRVAAPPRRIDFVEVPKDSSTRRVRKMLRSGRPLWLVLDLRMAPTVNAAVEPLATPIERASDGRYRIYRLEPRE